MSNEALREAVAQVHRALFDAFAPPAGIHREFDVIRSALRDQESALATHRANYDALVIRLGEVTTRLEAEIARLKSALERAECYRRCSRIHPHCQLRLTRDGAPDDGWHWAVTMPDGHMYDLSRGRMTYEQALADMQKRGVVALDAADVIWRQSHPTHLKAADHG